MIYILEDDSSIRELIVYTLKSTGFDAMGFENADEFFPAVKENLPQLILLDIMLPGQDGISVLKQLRSSSLTAKLPIIMLTAKGSEYDKVLGLDNGADDYISKPFGMMELVSRIKALLRRTSNSHSDNSILTCGCITVDTKKHTVTAGGEDIILTYKEFELLCMLLQNEQIVLTREQILSRIWNYDYEGETRTVDVHIRTLRQKLGISGYLIETIRGVGYRIGGK